MKRQKKQKKQRQAHAFVDDPRLPSVGATIVKHYRGRRVEVLRLADGFRTSGEIAAINGKTWPSLSRIASTLTGHPTNGFAFFGLADEDTPAIPPAVSSAFAVARRVHDAARDAFAVPQRALPRGDLDGLVGDDAAARALLDGAAQLLEASQALERAARLVRGRARSTSIVASARLQ